MRKPDYPYNTDLQTAGIEIKFIGRVQLFDF